MNQPVNPNKSCFGCPSLLQPGAESVAFFNKSIGVPVCARFGKPVGTLGMEERDREKLAKQLAKHCPDHGKQRPATVDWSRASFTVMLPDPEVLGATQSNPELVRSCNTCQHFVREDIVANEIGWPTGLCSAKGRLVLANRYTYEAKNCEYRSFGTVRTDIGNLVMLPEYEEDWKPSSDPAKNYFRARAHFVDPVEYETDKPITEDDEKSGIRAWREITDPETGNSVYLPIYRIDFFSPEEQRKIPRTGDDEHPEDYVDHNFFTYKVAVLWTELDETPGFWGEAGTGKTEFFRYMAWLMCLPFERFSITGSTELEDLAGKMHFSKEKGTYWTDGRMVKAWSKPCVMVVDEPNVGPPDVWQFMRPMIDNSKQLVLDMNNGESRDRHTDCYVGMAMNPAWDPKNVGANMVSDADANRLMHMFLELPPPELEREIIKARCKHDGYDIPRSQLDSIMKIAEDIRALCENQTLPITWAIRPQLKVARASRWFDLMTAYRMASADFLEPEAQQQLLDVVRSHVS